MDRSAMFFKVEINEGGISACDDLVADGCDGCQCWVVGWNELDVISFDHRMGVVLQQADKRRKELLAVAC